MKPPGLWTHLLRAVLPPGDREIVTAELSGLHRTKAQLTDRRSADAWYRREVLAFAVRVPLDRFRSRIPRKESPMTDLFTDLGREVRQAVRALFAQPGITLVAGLALVLGIGANALIFSIVDHVVLRPLPYEEPERLVALWPNSFPLRAEIDYFEENATTLQGIGSFYREDGFNAELTDGSRRLSGNRISPSLLDVLGVQPLLGRNFAADARAPGQTSVVLLSHGFWRSQFGADTEIVGTTLTLDGVAHEIVGVLPPGFAFPDADQDVLVPYELDPADAGAYWGSGGYAAIGRLGRGVAPEQVREELAALAEQTRELNPLWTPTEGFRAQSTIVPLQDSLVGGVQSNLLILLGAVGLVLLVACANVANLLLARGMARGHDTAVRAALGASRRRLLRQQLIESGVLVLAGCAAAIGVARLALEATVALLPDEIPRAGEIALDGRVVAVSVAAALVAGLLASLVPALRAARVDAGLALREGGRGAGTSASRRRLSAGMVVVQVAAAVVLVTGAGLLVRTLGALSQVDPGFSVDDVTVATLTLTPQDYGSAEERLSFFEQVADRVAAFPEVEAAAFASHVPFGPGWGGIATFIEDVTPDPNSLPVLSRVLVSNGYFQALGIPLKAGRVFDGRDRTDSTRVAVVDETMAERFWPGDNPLGKRIRYPWRGAPWIEVVGVVGGVADQDLGADRSPTFYVPMRQVSWYSATLVARSASGNGVDIAGIRRAVAAVDERTPVSGAGPMRWLLADSLERARWSAVLFAMFAALTLVLGCIGVYGVVAYSVGERTRDFGVQMALGADPGRIRRGVLREGLALALPGAAIGLLAAWPAARALESLLFGVPPTDPVTFLSVPVILILATLAAVYVPARRATRVDPAEALRADA